MDALKAAIDIAGGVSALAERLGVGQSAVSNWRKRKNVPLDRCVDIARVTNGRVSVIDLRPDVADALSAPKRKGKAAQSITG